MRGLKRDRTARVIMRGHAFMQNLRRGHYELGVEARADRRVAAAFTELWWRGHLRASTPWSLSRSSTGSAADVTWVDAMIRKHEAMPTNRLVLVSWSGFTATALRPRRVDRRLSVLAWTPEVVLDANRKPRVSRPLYMDQIYMTPRDVRIWVRRPDDSEVWFRAQTDHNLYDRDHDYVGSILELSHANLNSEAVVRRLSVEAHNHFEREQLNSFHLADLSLLGMDLWVRWEGDAAGSNNPPLEWHRVEKIYIGGDLDGRKHR